MLKTAKSPSQELRNYDNKLLSLFKYYIKSALNKSKGDDVRMPSNYRLNLYFSNHMILRRHPDITKEFETAELT